MSDIYRTGRDSEYFTRFDDMALNFPPDGWEVKTGTWGTEYDESTTVVKSGARSLHFKSGTPASVLRVESTQFIPVEPSRSYLGECTVQADSTTAGNFLAYRVNWYQADKPASGVTPS